MIIHAEMHAGQDAGLANSWQEGWQAAWQAAWLAAAAAEKTQQDARAAAEKRRQDERDAAEKDERDAAVMPEQDAAVMPDQDAEQDVVANPQAYTAFVLLSYEEMFQIFVKRRIPLVRIHAHIVAVVLLLTSSYLGGNPASHSFLCPRHLFLDALVACFAQKQDRNVVRFLSVGGDPRELVYSLVNRILVFAIEELD